ncbi:DUF4222 domain-containing protein [Serratia fonticola]
MKTINTGLASGGSAHPEIRPGDIYRDSRGVQITVTDYAYNRVTYLRDGYQHPCICTPERFEREFKRVRGETITEWCSKTPVSEKIEKLKKVIRERRQHP